MIPPRRRGSCDRPASSDAAVAWSFHQSFACSSDGEGLRSDWEAWHGPDDGGWRSEDCSVWLAAVLLHDMGLEPSVVYAEADPEAMF